MISFINYIGYGVLSWHRKLRQVYKVTMTNVHVRMPTCVYPCTEFDFNIALCLKKLTVHFSELVPTPHLCGQYSFMSYVLEVLNIHQYTNTDVCAYFFLQVTRHVIDL